MGDWICVPHSPLAGDSLSFHLPLHRALAKSVRSICPVLVSEYVCANHPHAWWRIPVLDDDRPSSTMERILLKLTHNRLDRDSNMPTTTTLQPGRLHLSCGLKTTASCLGISIALSRFVAIVLMVVPLQYMHCSFKTDARTRWSEKWTRYNQNALDDCISHVASRRP